jgi:Uncharacterised protein family (UPF0149)
MLDGYAATIVAGPVSMSPLDWICPLLAIDVDAFNHGDTPEFAAISAVALRHNDISNVLTTAPDRFEPMHRRDPNGNVDPCPWCQGFYAAIRLRVSAWAPLLAAVEPRNRPFDDPTAWKYYKSFGVIGALDDFSFEIGEDFRQGLLEFRSLKAAVGKQPFQERIHPEQCRKKQNTAVAVLDIGRMNNRVQQQTQRIYENMALLALGLFTRIIAMRIDAGPPFSALFTLWLSMMAAVGLASRSPCSRHSTYRA